MISSTVNKHSRSEMYSIRGLYKRTAAGGAASKKQTKAPKKAPIAKLRSSITPGTILILLSGKYAGKRVVFLKQLPSGLLLVTGPFKLNGVPLKRVDQSYVIATSTKIDISSISAADLELDEKIFKNTQKSASKGFFEDKEAEATPVKHVVNEKVKAACATIDAKLTAAIKQVPSLSSYLKSSFSLKKGQAPHAMKF